MDGVADGADGAQLGVAVIRQAAGHQGAALAAMSDGAVKHHEMGSNWGTKKALAQV
jgi:hypothetical protein